MTVCQEIEELIRAAPLPGELETAILEAYAELEQSNGPGLRVAVKDEALYVNERRVPIDPLVYRRRNNGAMTAECLPVVGGWRCIAEKDELTETEAVVAMRQLTEQWRGKTVSVVLKLEDVSWTDVPVVNAYCGGHLLGCVAPELADAVCDKTFEPTDALVSMRGKTIYALLLA